MPVPPKGNEHTCPREDVYVTINEHRCPREDVYVTINEHTCPCEDMYVTIHVGPIHNTPKRKPLTCPSIDDG